MKPGLSCSSEPWLPAMGDGVGMESLGPQEKGLCPQPTWWPHGQLGLWEQHVAQQHTAQVPTQSGISGMLQLLLFTDAYCDPEMLELSAQRLSGHCVTHSTEERPGLGTKRDKLVWS